MVTATVLLLSFLSELTCFPILIASCMLDFQKNLPPLFIARGYF